MQFHTTSPIYLQIADDLRHQILTGALDDGDQVMSTTAYATTYRINPATAAKAFAHLVDEGLLEKRRGIGVFVSSGARKRLTTARSTIYLSQTLAPAVAEGLALGMSVPELISHVRSLATDMGSQARPPSKTQG